VSTCHRLLKACHLIKTRKMRVRRAVSAVMAAVVAKAPNQVWTVDFKGWWRTRDGRRCEPLTVRDAYSRFVLSAHVPANSKTQSVHAEFVRLFRQYGLPQVIKSDNGAPFAIGTTPLGLTKLSAYWVALGIQLEHSRPAHPQDNGAHERLHRDMEVEVAAHVQRDAATQQAALDVWREDFNQIRPHEHLGGQRPADLYHVSPRAWPGEDLSLDYGPGFLPRLVTSTGTIRFRGRLIFITTAVAGWHVGLRIIAADLAEVWFNYVRLGTLDLKTHRFGFAPSRSAKAVGLAA